VTTINFSARKISNAGTAQTQCAVVPVFTRKQLSNAAKQVDKSCDGVIFATLKLGDFKGEVGQTAFLPGSGNIKRILLVGAGSPRKLDTEAARKILTALYSALNGTQAKEATVHLEELAGAKNDVTGFVEQLAQTLTSKGYRYSETVSKPKTPLSLRKLVVNPGNALSARATQSALDCGLAIGNGINTAKELADLPGNICTPSFLAKRARKLGREHDKLTTSILDEKKMQQLGMGALLSVTAGSDEPAKFIIMDYKGAAASKKPYVLVGKGITFDSGGISLKPGAKMDEMKYDMGGAASVFGSLSAITHMQLPINVVGIIAAAENMPSSSATRPGDVVTSMSGKTIEILNTDAEGRLVLSDALTYAERYKPQAVIDIATLTGACVVALGGHTSGLFSNQDKLAEQLLAAGQAVSDRAWRLPIWDDYQKQLDSNFADVANIGSPGAGSITAACFLARFAEKYPWAHIDVAGTAWSSAPKGATGRPVALLTRYLMDRAASGK